MKEQSQIDAMRAAVRGDIERSRARRESTDADAEERPPVEVRARPEQPISMQRAKPVPVEEAAVPTPPVEAMPESVDAPRRGVLSRLFRRG